MLITICTADIFTYKMISNVIDYLNILMSGNCCRAVIGRILRRKSCQFHPGHFHSRSFWRHCNTILVFCFKSIHLICHESARRSNPTDFLYGEKRIVFRSIFTHNDFFTAALCLPSGRIFNQYISSYRFLIQTSVIILLNRWCFFDLRLLWESTFICQFFYQPKQLAAVADAVILTAIAPYVLSLKGIVYIMIIRQLELHIMITVGNGFICFSVNFYHAKILVQFFDCFCIRYCYLRIAPHLIV